MVFTIRQNSTLPILKMKLTSSSQMVLEDLFKEGRTIDVSFSMRDEKTERYMILNDIGRFHTKIGSNGSPEYFISYRFSEKNTEKVGTFIASFMIAVRKGADIIHILRVPIIENLYINIKESIGTNEAPKNTQKGGIIC